MLSEESNLILFRGISSICGSAFAEMCTLPLCTIKTNYQVNNLTSSSVWNQTKHIYLNKGFKGFYSAVYPAVIGQVISTSTKYTFYQYIQQKRKTPKDDLLNNSLNGMMGGIFGSIFSHPIDVVKNSYQRDGLIFKEIKQHGLHLYYRGYSKTICKTLVLYGTLFPLYDTYKILFNDNIVYSTVATSLSTSVILQPLDYMRTRHMGGNFSKSKNYFKGFYINLFRSMIHFSITMLITEHIYSYFKP